MLFIDLQAGADHAHHRAGWSSSSPWRFRRIARRTSTQARRVLAEVNANVQESVTGIGVAKNFRQEQRIYDEFKPVNAQSYRLSLRQGLTFSSIFPVLGTVAGIGTALVVYFGGMSVIGGVVTPGRLVPASSKASALFWFPLTSIASFWSQFQLGLAASERVFALIDAEPRVVQTDNQPAPPLARPHRVSRRRLPLHRQGAGAATIST